MIGFFIGFLTVVLILVCLLTVLIVLMQRPKQEGLGAAFGGGVTDQMFGAQTTNVLQRGTVYLAVLFFGITMLLAILVGVKQKAMLSKEDLSKAVAGDTPPPNPTPNITSPTIPPIDESGSGAIDEIPGLIPEGGDDTPATPEPDAPDEPELPSIPAGPGTDPVEPELPSVPAEPGTDPVEPEADGGTGEGESTTGAEGDTGGAAEDPAGTTP